MVSRRRAHFPDEEPVRPPTPIPGQSEVYDPETGLAIADYSALPPDSQPAFQEMFEREQGIAAVYFLADVQKANSHFKFQRRVLCVMRDAIFLCTPHAEVLRCVKLQHCTELFRHGERFGVHCPELKYDLLFTISHHNKHDADALADYLEQALSRLRNMATRGIGQKLIVHQDQEWLSLTTEQHRKACKAFLQLKRPASYMVNYQRPLPVPLIPWRDIAAQPGFFSLWERLANSRRDKVWTIKEELEKELTRALADQYCLRDESDGPPQLFCVDVAESIAGATDSDPPHEVWLRRAARSPPREEGLFDLYAAAAAAATPVDPDTVLLSALGREAADARLLGPHDLRPPSMPSGRAAQTVPAPAPAAERPRPPPPPASPPCGSPAGCGARATPPAPLAPPPAQLRHAFPPAPPLLASPQPPGALTPPPQHLPAESCVVYTHEVQSGYIPPPLPKAAAASPQPPPAAPPQPGGSRARSTPPPPGDGAFISAPPPPRNPEATSPLRSPAAAGSPGELEDDIAALQLSIDLLRQHGSPAAAAASPALGRALRGGDALSPRELLRVARDLAAEQQLRRGACTPTPAFAERAASCGEADEPHLPPPPHAPEAAAGSAGNAREGSAAPERGRETGQLCLAELLADSLQRAPGGPSSAAAMAQALMDATKHPSVGGDVARRALSDLLRGAATLVDARTEDSRRRRALQAQGRLCRGASPTGTRSPSPSPRDQAAAEGAADPAAVLAEACSRLDNVLAAAEAAGSRRRSPRRQAAAAPAGRWAEPFSESPARRDLARMPTPTGVSRPSGGASPNAPKGLSKYQRLLLSSMRGFREIVPRNASPLRKRRKDTRGAPAKLSASPSPSTSARRKGKCSSPRRSVPPDPLTAALRSSEFRSLRAASFPSPGVVEPPVLWHATPNASPVPTAGHMRRV